MSVLDRVEAEPLSQAPLILPLYASKETFGWATLHDYRLQEMGKMNLGEYELLEIPLEPNVEVNLDAARDALRKNDKVLPDLLDLELAQLFNGTVFADWAEQYRQAGWGWKDVLTEGFSDAQLMAFMEWNMQFTADKQAQFEKQLPAIMARYVDKVNEGIAAGWLPSQVAGRLTMLNAVDFYVGDVFMTEGAGQCGYYSGNLENSGKIVISSLRVDDEAALEALLFHEMTHAITGSGWWAHVNDKETWLNEAMTEHITQTLLGASTFDDMSHPRGPFYVAERKLLNEITKMISKKWLVNLYFTDDSDQHAYIGAAIDKIFANNDYYDEQISIYDTTTDRHQQSLVMRRLTHFAKIKSIKHAIIQAAGQ